MFLCFIFCFKLVFCSQAHTVGAKLARFENSFQGDLPILLKEETQFSFQWDIRQDFQGSANAVPLYVIRLH